MSVILMNSPTWPFLPKRWAKWRGLCRGNTGNNRFKESDKDKQLDDELADVLFVLICIANQTNVDLTAALQRNLEKKTKRDSERHAGNEKLK